MKLRDVELFSIPATVVADTERSLRLAGDRGLELFVLWSGVIDGRALAIRTAHVPPQMSYQLEDGLMVRVDGPALHELNAWLYDHQEILAVQVHAHPTDAFHSETDDTYPIVTAEGSVSIVAADFCSKGLFSDSTAAYRLTKGYWRQLASPLSLLRVI